MRSARTRWRGLWASSQCSALRSLFCQRLSSWAVSLHRARPYLLCCPVLPGFLCWLECCWSASSPSPPKPGAAGGALSRCSPLSCTQFDMGLVGRLGGVLACAFWVLLGYVIATAEPAPAVQPSVTE